MSAEGKPVLTDAPWSIDHGGENTGRFPLPSIVDGVSRKVWKRETLPHLLSVRSSSQRGRAVQAAVNWSTM